MEILKFPHGEVRMCDCFDGNIGIQFFKEKEFDLCLTDPPYGINLKTPVGLGDSPIDKWRKGTHLYDDSLTGIHYQKWCYNWMDILLLICENIYFTPGTMNLKMWYKVYDIYDQIILYAKNRQSGGKAAHFQRHEPLLVMNKPKKHQKVVSSVIENFLKNGFLKKRFFSHPCPKNYAYWFQILARFKPKFLLDPFVGSGTTVEACEELGINYICYERDPYYIKDIKQRAKDGIRKYKTRKIYNQQTLKGVNNHGR